MFSKINIWSDDGAKSEGHQCIIVCINIFFKNMAIHPIFTEKSNRKVILMVVLEEKSGDHFKSFGFLLSLQHLVPTHEIDVKVFHQMSDTFGLLVVLK